MASIRTKQATAPILHYDTKEPITCYLCGRTFTTSRQMASRFQDCGYEKLVCRQHQACLRRIAARTEAMS